MASTGWPMLVVRWLPDGWHIPMAGLSLALVSNLRCQEHGPAGRRPSGRVWPRQAGPVYTCCFFPLPGDGALASPKILQQLSACLFGMGSPAPTVRPCPALPPALRLLALLVSTHLLCVICVCFPRVAGHDACRHTHRLSAGHAGCSGACPSASERRGGASFLVASATLHHRRPGQRG